MGAVAERLVPRLAAAAERRTRQLLRAPVGERHAQAAAHEQRTVWQRRHLELRRAGAGLAAQSPDAQRRRRTAPDPVLDLLRRILAWSDAARGAHARDGTP